MLSKAQVLPLWVITNTIHASPGGWTNFLIPLQKIIIIIFIIIIIVVIIIIIIIIMVTMIIISSITQLVD